MPNSRKFTLETAHPGHNCQGRSPHTLLKNAMNRISVIIPVKEEMKLQFHRKIIESYKAFPNCELLWIVAPNNDGTYEDLLAHRQRVIQSNSNSRAERINIGIKATQNSLILVNHPRSFLSSKAINRLSKLDINEQKIWGGFTHEFYQSKHPILKFTSFYSNTVRFGLFGIIYLDHCIFFSRSLISPQDPTPVPAVDIFEDTLFSQKLLMLAKPQRIREKSYTSPVRFNTNGIFKQSLMNQTLKIKHLFGFSNKKMNEYYEKNLNLISKY